MFMYYSFEFWFCTTFSILHWDLLILYHECRAISAWSMLSARLTGKFMWRNVHFLRRSFFLYLSDKSYPIDLLLCIATYFCKYYFWVYNKTLKLIYIFICILFVCFFLQTSSIFASISLWQIYKDISFIFNNNCFTILRLWQVILQNIQGKKNVKDSLIL